MNGNRYGKNNRVGKSENAGYFKNQQKSNKLEMEGKLSRPDRTMRRRAARKKDRSAVFSSTVKLSTYKDIQFLRTFMNYLDRKENYFATIPRGYENLNEHCVDLLPGDYERMDFDMDPSEVERERVEIRDIYILVHIHYTNKSADFFLERVVKSSYFVRHSTWPRDAMFVSPEIDSNETSNYDRRKELLGPLEDRLKELLKNINSQITKPVYRNE